MGSMEPGLLSRIWPTSRSSCAGRDYSVLDRPEIKSRLHLPADQQFSRSESGLVRQLYDCPDVPVGPEGCRCRVVVATHPAASKKSRIGHTREARGLRTLFHASAARGVHRLRCAGPLRGLVGPLNQCLPMKIRSKTPTGGVVTRPLDRKPGRLSRNGSGISVWSWVICLHRRRCARPSLLLPSPRPQRNKDQGKAMASLRLPCPGKRGVSRARTSPSNPTECCTVQRARRCAQPSSKALLMAVCACSTAPGSASVVAAQSVRSVSGMGKQPRSPVASVYCSILFRLVPRLCSGGIGAGESIGAD